MTPECILDARVCATILNGRQVDEGGEMCFRSKYDLSTVQTTIPLEMLLLSPADDIYLLCQLVNVNVLFRECRL